MRVAAFCFYHILVLGRDHSRVILILQGIQVFNFCWFKIFVFVGPDHSHMILWEKKVDHSNVIYLYS